MKSKNLRLWHRSCWAEWPGITKLHLIRTIIYLSRIYNMKTTYEDANNGSLTPTSIYFHHKGMAAIEDCGASSIWLAWLPGSLSRHCLVSSVQPLKRTETRQL
ncbi:hypothetical protein F0562_004736 [Nyssa sinensis]|uniref:Uncharacterized protein n=1 Tax=Nyssa sinensis TaxID=561372 RepID=A0A5J5C2Y7_9ASTE|nr:hypothetical protein F0562_004736 [Nyssa sinensis]